MKKTVSLLSCLLVVQLCAWAGPYRSVRSSQFLGGTPLPCGPFADPMALKGQWFVDVNTAVETPSAWEFHDDDNSLCIRGTVVAITWGSPYAGHTNITGFTVLATVQNNLPESFPGGISSNSHSEIQGPTMTLYHDTMKRTRLAVEFAVAEAGPGGPPWVGVVPPATGLQPPYYPDPRSGGTYVIEAINENLAAWYCSFIPFPPGNPAGAYYVPAWELGDIPPGGSATIPLVFAIRAYGGGPAEMPVTDIRHGVIRHSFYTGSDVLYNRHDSLKISHWIDLVLIDIGYLIQSFWEPPEEEPVEYIYASDASVFFDSAYPDEKTLLNIGLTATNKAPDAATLSWTMFDIKTYGISHCDNLLSNVWTDVFLPSFTPPVIPFPMRWTDDGSQLTPPITNQAQRFYRLISM